MSREIQPPNSDRQPPRWVVVHATQNLLEAYVVAGRLQSEGIETWVQQEPGARAYGITIGTWGEVRVLVHEHDYDNAWELLNTPLPDELEADNSSIIYDMPDDDPESDDDQ